MRHSVKIITKGRSNGLAVEGHGIEIGSFSRPSPGLSPPCTSRATVTSSWPLPAPGARLKIGVMWATDYPHQDGFFPGAPQMLRDRLGPLSPEAKHQVLAGGALGFYGMN